MASVLCMVLLFSQNGNFRVAMKKVIECCSGNAKLPRGLRAGNAVGKHLANVFAAVVKASFLIARAESAAERYAFGFFAVQRIGRDDVLHAFAHVQGKVETLKNIHGLLVWPRRIIFFDGNEAQTVVDNELQVVSDIPERTAQTDDIGNKHGMAAGLERLIQIADVRIAMENVYPATSAACIILKQNLLFLPADVVFRYIQVSDNH